MNLDDAWPTAASPAPTHDLREWGPQLRFSAPARAIEEFYAAVRPEVAPFLLYGSGDFHHLTALWLRRLERLTTVISFDNHPDWDIRPPRWACGGWVNRALELSHVQKISVWGCGNFECWWPTQIFGNRRAERSRRLEVHPWADDRQAADRERRGAILRADWRKIFERFAAGLGGGEIYVTIDLDCLRAEEAVTNWESGRFEISDLTWALRTLRAGGGRIVAGDICGAYSVPAYARRQQRFVSEMDHPKITAPPRETRERINHAALAALWPVLTEGNEDDSGRD